MKPYPQISNLTLILKRRIRPKEHWAQESDGEMAKRPEEILQPDPEFKDVLHFAYKLSEVP